MEYNKVLAPTGISFSCGKTDHKEINKIVRQWPIVIETMKKANVLSVGEIYSEI